MSSERPGLANERTALGWQRSALSLAAIAGLLLGRALAHGRAAGVVSAALGIAAAAWATLRGRRLYARRAAGGRAEAPRSLRALALCSAGAAVLAIVVLLEGG